MTLRKKPKRDRPWTILFQPSFAFPPVPAELFEGRDLRPTTDLRTLFKAALAAQLGVSEAPLETRVFPDSRSARPLEGIFA